MTSLQSIAISSTICTISLTSQAQTTCTADQTCVPKEDLRDMVAVLKTQRCFKTERPEFKIDPIVVFTDVAGRLYVSGAAPYPWKLHMKWCSNEVEAAGVVHIEAAKILPQKYGLRFRPKAWIGYLPREALDAMEVGAGIDAGAMLDFLYWHWLNLNAAVGVRSGGLGIGADLTENFGLYTGWAVSWGNWNQNANVAAWFGF